MRTVAFGELEISQIAEAMAHGRPWLPESTDYWFFKYFHGSTSFAVAIEQIWVGGIIACVESVQPPQLYVDQVAVHPSFRHRGVVQQLFHVAEERAKALGCVRAWLSTDPRNPAVRVWPRLGYANCLGDHTDGVIAICSNFKGPGKDRALFEKVLASK